MKCEVAPLSFYLNEHGFFFIFRWVVFHSYLDENLLHVNWIKQ